MVLSLNEPLQREAEAMGQEGGLSQAPDTR